MHSILVIRGGALGDLIVTLPAIRLLRNRWPGAKVSLLGYPRLGEIGRHRGYFDHVRSVDFGPLANFFVPAGILDPELMEYFGGFDLVVSYFFDPDGIFIANLRRCRPAQIVSYSPKVAAAPAAKHFCRGLAEIGLATSDFASRVYPNEEDRAAARAFLGEDPRPVVAIHPGSGGEIKNWPLDRWAAWANRRADDPAWRWLVVSGESDTERAEALVRAWAGPPPLRAHGLALPTLAAVLASCRLFIGHDSGITHLAAAAGCPVVALFGPTDPAVWAPQGERVTVVQRGPAIADIQIADLEAAAGGYFA